MALDLHIPPCIHSPAQPRYPPPLEQPLRIQIEGPLVSIEKLLPGVEWQLEGPCRPSLQPTGPELARVAFRTIYGQDVRPDVDGDIVVRDEYLGWVMEDPKPWTRIDYYGVTFDHLVPSDDTDPEVLQINIIEMDYDEGAYANEHLPFYIDPTKYRGRMVLAVPRCCQKRKGTQDRTRINESVIRRDELMREIKKEDSSPAKIGL
ncbi:hypothetical protein CDV36_013534 [Fusarium kuroshium]|uniref:Uncharacterized protein n=2 Tax=Fusarium solani species complex TaxID=232080 RepID=A0A3M2RPT4_9HYPO|nr:hypothetical protein CDV36_013534 [Fusarium kuroshium]RSL73513.1 hypothetical protein CEP51_011738 [Fusarium floridanum]